MTDELSHPTAPLPALIDSPPDDLSLEAVTLVNPATGEMFALVDAGDAKLGEYLQAVREWESMARLAKQVVSAEIHRRMDAEASWTRRDGPIELVGQSPDRVEYPVDEMRAVLRELAGEGLISDRAARGALKREVVFTVSKRGVNALLKIGGEVAERIKAVGREPAQARRVTVKGPPQ